MEQSEAEVVCLPTIEASGSQLDAAQSSAQDVADKVECLHPIATVEVFEATKSVQHAEPTKSIEIVESAKTAAEATASSTPEGVVVGDASKKDAETRLSKSSAARNPNRFMKGKVALLVGYVGTAYRGLQINPGVETIEKVLEEAVAEAGGISEENRNNLQKISWQRAARTDKGVHAAVNVISLKMRVDDDEILDKIRLRLPSDIVVYGFHRTTQSFNSKIHCSSRHYEYVCPSFVFSGVSSPSESYRLCDERKALVQKLLQSYRGTQRYHNFTSGRGSMDESTKRFIISFDVHKVFVRDGVEFVSLVVHGASFMIHQIRKMVAAVVAVCQGLVPEDLFCSKEFFDPAKKWFIPIAPSRGLFLRRPVFDMYNKSLKKSSGRGPLSYEPFEDKLNAFVNDRIYPEVCTGQKEFSDWVSMLHERGGAELNRCESIPIEERRKPADKRKAYEDRDTSRSRRHGKFARKQKKKM